jgi:hypothetical protein
LDVQREDEVSWKAVRVGRKANRAMPEVETKVLLVSTVVHLYFL